jgi:hypothetical protein
MKKPRSRCEEDTMGFKHVSRLMISIVLFSLSMSACSSEDENVALESSPIVSIDTVETRAEVANGGASATIDEDASPPPSDASAAGATSEDEDEEEEVFYTHLESPRVSAEDYEACGLKVLEEIWGKIPGGVVKDLKKAYDADKCAKATKDNDRDGIIKDCALKAVCDFVPGAKATPMCIAIKAGKILERCLVPIINFAANWVMPNVMDKLANGYPPNCAAMICQEGCNACCNQDPTKCSDLGRDKICGGKAKCT